MATHLNQLFGSGLCDDFELEQFQVGSQGRDENWLQALGRLASSPFSLSAAIVRFSPDIVHINSSLGAKPFWRDLVYMVVAKVLGRRVVYQIHGGSLDRFRAIRAFMSWALRLPDKIVVLSNEDKRGFERFRIGRAPLVVPNAITNDAPFQSGEARNKTTWNVVYLGRLVEGKGLSQAVDAINILKQEEKFTGLRFLIAGEGPAEVSLRAKIRTLGLESTVQLIGAVRGADKWRFLGQADVFLFPTLLDEGLPYAVLECFAAGLPLVTTQVGGIADAVRHGVEGIFADPRNPEDIARALCDILTSAETRERMRKACLERSADYSVERLERQFRQVYMSLLRG